MNKPFEKKLMFSSLFNKALQLAAHKKYNEAIQIFNQAATLYPSNSYTYSNIGAAFIELGKYKEAVINLEKSLILNPNNFVALNNMGAALNGLGRFFEAIVNLDKALLLNPNYAESHFNKGQVFLLMKRKNDSIECFETALAIDPDLKERVNRAKQIIFDRKLSSFLTERCKSVLQIINFINKGCKL